jgi:hypothetical protein
MARVLSYLSPSPERDEQRSVPPPSHFRFARPILGIRDSAPRFFRLVAHRARFRGVIPVDE